MSMSVSIIVDSQCDPFVETGFSFIVKPDSVSLHKWITAFPWYQVINVNKLFKLDCIVKVFHMYQINTDITTVVQKIIFDTIYNFLCQFYVFIFINII